VDERWMRQERPPDRENPMRRRINCRVGGTYLKTVNSIFLHSSFTVKDTQT